MDTPHTSWLGLIDPYMKLLRHDTANPTVLRLVKELQCPMAPDLALPGAGVDDVRRPYGYNLIYLGGGGYKSPSMSSVTSPAGTIRVLEVWQYPPGGSGSLKSPGSGSLYCWPPASQAGIAAYCHPPGWHTVKTPFIQTTPALLAERRKGLNMVLWMDSHVSAETGGKIMNPPVANKDAYFDPKAIKP